MKKYSFALLVFRSLFGKEIETSIFGESGKTSVFNPSVLESAGISFTNDSNLPTKPYD